MKRLVFGLAVVGLFIVLAPALLSASEFERSTLPTDGTADVDLNELRAEVGQLPLVFESPKIQLVDHCYRRSYRGYGGGRHGARYVSPYDYAPRRSSYYSGRHYDYGRHYHAAPRSSYYRGGFGGYNRSGFGLYIGF